MLIDLLGETPKIYAEITPELLVVKSTAESMIGPFMNSSVSMAKTRPTQSLDLGVNLFSVKPQLSPTFSDPDKVGWLYRFTWTDSDYLEATSRACLITLLHNLASNTWSCWLKTEGPGIELDLPHFDVNAGLVSDPKATAKLNPSVWNRLGCDDDF